MFNENVFDMVNSDYSLDVFNDVKLWYERDRVLSELISFGIIENEKGFYDIFDCVVVRLCIFFYRVERGRFVKRMIFNFMNEKDEKLWLWRMGEKWVRERIGEIYEKYESELKNWE